MDIVLCSEKTHVRSRWRDALQTADWGLREVPGNERLLSNGAGIGAAMILLHLPLDGVDRTAVVSSAVAKFAHARVMIFSDMPSDDDGLAILRLGAAGYCNTYMNPQLLRMAVEIVDSGEIWAGKSLIRKLVSAVAGGTVPPLRPGSNNRSLDGLTERETEIATLVSAGASNKRVAQKLDITERTVKAHMSSLFRKTGTRDRLQLALLVNGGK